MKAGPVTKIRYRRVCEKPVDLLLNLGTRSKGTIYTYSEEPMVLARARGRARARYDKIRYIFYFPPRTSKILFIASPACSSFKAVRPDSVRAQR